MDCRREFAGGIRGVAEAETRKAGENSRGRGSPIAATPRIRGHSRTAGARRRDEQFEINVRWAVLPGMQAEGLLVWADKPGVRRGDSGREDRCAGDARGLMDGVPKSSQIGRRLADAGAHSSSHPDRSQGHLFGRAAARSLDQSNAPRIRLSASLRDGPPCHRLQLQKVLAGVDWFAKDKDHPPIWSSATWKEACSRSMPGRLDPHIRATVVSGVRDPREKIADEPIDRNLWGLLKDFGDAELARMIAPRTLLLEHGPVTTLPPPAARAGRSGAAPGRVPSPTLEAFRSEVDRIGALHPSMQGKEVRPDLFAATSAEPNDAKSESTLPGLPSTYKSLGTRLGLDLDVDRAFVRPEPLRLLDSDVRQKRQFDEAVDYTQKLLGPSAERRRENVWAKLDTTSLDRYAASQTAASPSSGRRRSASCPDRRCLEIGPQLAYDARNGRYEVVLDVGERRGFGILLVLHVRRENVDPSSSASTVSKADPATSSTPTRRRNTTTPSELNSRTAASSSSLRKILISSATSSVSSCAGRIRLACRCIPSSSPNMTAFSTGSRRCRSSTVGASRSMASPMGARWRCASRRFSGVTSSIARRRLFEWIWKNIVCCGEAATCSQRINHHAG